MTGRFPNDPDPASSWRQITQIGAGFADHARIVGQPEVIRFIRRAARWQTTAGS
ncbi:MAG: hypothetical protein WBG02_06645 [Candidatus Acidiferrum sp.]